MLGICLEQFRTFDTLSPNLVRIYHINFYAKKSVCEATMPFGDTFQTSKDDMPKPIIWTHTFKCLVVRCESENWHQKDRD